jgi:hypothetical protein
MAATRTAKAKTAETAATIPTIGFDDIAVRAYQIHLSGDGGEPVDDWLRAERELFAELEKGKPEEVKVQARATTRRTRAKS